MNTHKKTIAVIFGGRSAEHDVSVISALQTLEAIDTTKYTPLAVYIDPKGQWFIGDALFERQSYPLTPAIKNCDKVELALSESTLAGKGILKSKEKSLFHKEKTFTFDIAFPVLHGTNGEDGAFQGLMEMANIPYAGLRLNASTLLMDKLQAKRFFNSLGVPVLPAEIIKKPQTDGFIDVASLTKNMEIIYPVCAKPNNLGSSIGVHKCNNETELQTALLDIFKLDDSVIIEPFIHALVEYNVAVKRSETGTPHTSAIEKPIAKGDLLDFAAKYKSASGENKTSGSKLSVRLSQGMVQATREFAPKSLSKENESLIKETAELVFDQLNGTGAPRFDFYGNAETGEVWLNEVNPMPGSYGYFLWEAAQDPVGFTQLTTDLIEEALTKHTTKKMLATQANLAGGSLL